MRGKRSEPGEFANFYALRGKKSADSLSLLLEDILRVRLRAGPSTLPCNENPTCVFLFWE